jgi:tetratricopeptide (TPR) repeat protein
MKYITITFLLLLGLGSIEAQETEIKNIFSEINASIVAKNVDGILIHYNSTNKSFLEKSQSRYENLLKLDSLSYFLKMNDFSVHGDTVIAIVYEKKSYSEHGRGNTDVNWLTFALVQIQENWRVVDMQERNYLQAEFADIDMKFNPSEHYMSATAKIELSIIEGGENNLLFLLNRGLSINKLTDSKGRSLPFEISNLVVEIPWKTKLKKGEKLILFFEYSGDFFNEFSELGYSLVNIGPEGCFANFVTQWYPKLNGPLTKSKANLTYTVPSDLVVASVGKFIKKEETNNLVTYTYKVGTPMDYTFNANTFFYYGEEVDGIQVNVYFLEGNKEKAKMYADKSMEIVNYLKDLYGIFPYDSYNITEVPPEITKSLGGSGGQGLNFYPSKTLRNEVFEFPLISHEVGHMWWGSWVMSDDISRDMIDEGFSQLNAVLCYRHFFGEKAMWDFLKNGGDLYPQSAKEYFARFGSGENDSPIGIYDESSKRYFNSLAYVKSHFVYAMLMETVGYDTFIKGIRRIISEYGNKKRFNITNLQEIMEAESDMDLDYFFDQWFYRKGAPEFKLDYEVTQRDNGRYQVSGKVHQLRDTFLVTAEIEFAYTDRREIQKLAIKGRETRFSFLLNQKPKAILFDPDYKILRWTDDFKIRPELNEAIINTFTGKDEEAIKKLTEILIDHPNNLEVHAILGKAYLNIKKYDLAETYLKIVTDDYEVSGKMSFYVIFSHTWLGETYDAIGDMDKAKVFFSKALHLPNIGEAHEKAEAFFKKMKDEKN